VFYSLIHILLTAADSVVSEPQTAGNVSPQPWVIIAVLLIATGAWFFTRNRKR